MDTELFRSWCLELPKTSVSYAGQKETYKVESKTFAFINENQITLKCSPKGYLKAIAHPDIELAKGLSRYNWISINRFDNLQVEDMHDYILDSYQLIISNFPKKIRNKLQKKLLHEIDSPWKDVLNVFFKEFMEFFFPEIAEDIDWTKKPIFMDKELSKIIRESKRGNRFVDKLVKVWRKNGDLFPVLAHMEVQAQKQFELPERVFIYSGRTKDIYDLSTASFIILADDDPDWRPSEFREELWGCVKTISFPVIKILDYKDKWKELEKSDNPFALIVMTHLKMLETKKDKSKRLYWKEKLTIMIYNRGYPEEQMFALYKFIDWLLVLPDDLAKTYQKKITKYKEKFKMKYLTTTERFNRREGRIEGRKEGRKEGEIKGRIETLKEMRAMNLLPKKKYDQLIKPLQTKLTKI